MLKFHSGNLTPSWSQRQSQWPDICSCLPIYRAPDEMETFLVNNNEIALVHFWGTWIHAFHDAAYAKGSNCACSAVQTVIMTANTTEERSRPTIESYTRRLEAVHSAWVYSLLNQWLYAVPSGHCWTNPMHCRSSAVKSDCNLNNSS